MAVISANRLQASIQAEGRPLSKGPANVFIEQGPGDGLMLIISRAREMLNSSIVRHVIALSGEVHWRSQAQ
jgi:hypothetical protein